MLQICYQRKQNAPEVSIGFIKKLLVTGLHLECTSSDVFLDLSLIYLIMKCLPDTILSQNGMDLSFMLALMPESDGCRPQRGIQRVSERDPLPTENLPYTIFRQTRSMIRASCYLYQFQQGGGNDFVIVHYIRSAA